MKIDFNPKNEANWVEMLQSGNYEIGSSPFTKAGHKRIFLKRKKGVGDVPKVSRLFFIELPEAEARKFIKRVKEKANL